MLNDEPNAKHQGLFQHYRSNSAAQAGQRRGSISACPPRYALLGLRRRIAEILEVPVTSFFAGETQQKESRDSSPFNVFADAMTMNMAREFGKMADNKTRRAILPIVETLVA
jgi:hypothetical protein